MNREQRRKMKKEKPKNDMIGTALEMSAEYIKRKKEKITQAAVETLDAATLLAIRDCFGFGEKKMNRFRLKRYQILGDIIDKRLSIDDIWEVLSEEVYKGKIPSEEEILNEENKNGKLE